MFLRKLNAWISLATTLMLFNHAIFHAVWMLSRGSIEKSANGMPWVLFILMMLHAIISIILAILGHKGAEKCKTNSYPKMNKATIIQRASGISLILFSILHISGTAGRMVPPKIIHAIFPTLFFSTAVMHVAISGSKAFITLGIGNAKFIKIVDRVIAILCMFIFIASIIGVYLVMYARWLG